MRGRNCGEHDFTAACPACAQIVAWYAAGETHEPRRLTRTADEEAHAAIVAAILSGLPVPVIAERCAAILRHRAGTWATFAGPQSVMTARFWALAVECGEETGALLGRAA